MDEIYDYLKDKTYKKKIDGIQVKITAEEIKEQFSYNTQTVFANLRRLSKRKDVCNDVYLIKLTNYRDQTMIEQTFWWCE